MTIVSNDKDDQAGVVIHRGRMALEVLKSREQAARFHAASVDLQIALLEAEAGSEIFLQQWLEQYRPLIDQDPELQRHFASVQQPVEFAESDRDTIDELPLSAPNIAIANELAVAVPRQPHECNEVAMGPPESPWSAMILGANRRAVMRAETGLASIATLESSPESFVPPLLDDDFASDYLDEYREPTSNDSGDHPPYDASVVDISHDVPDSLQASLTVDSKRESRKLKAWLSPAVIGSGVAHLIALIAMSSYMIHLARNPEPKAIVASAFETEAISMEAPVEMNPDDAPTLDASDAPMPMMPAFASAPAASSSDIQLPTSVSGLVSNDASPSPTNGEIQQATSSTPSNSAAANSVQFFGVKAAGNTFCYVVDGSPSMNKDGAFMAAKAELLRSLSLLKPKQRFYISFFGGKIERLALEGRSEELYPVYATPENLQKTALWIERVRVQERGLPPNNALLEAIKMDPDGIFLLFDGDTKVDVPEYLRKANRSDDLISGGIPLVQIHTIGFYTQEFEAMMKRIAFENRGTYRFVPKPTKPR